MNILEKEIELLEKSIEKITINTEKLDRSSVTFFLISLIVFTTSKPDALIKLAVLGVELKVLNACFMLYILSLSITCMALFQNMRLTVINTHYKTVLKKQYGDIPDSLGLISFNYHDFQKVLFRDILNKSHGVLYYFIALSIIASYVWLGYQLLTYAFLSTYTLISSIYAVSLFCLASIYFIRYIVLDAANKPLKQDT